MSDSKKKHKVTVSWEYLRAMIRYVWISYPNGKGGATIRVHDRYTGRNYFHFISWN